MAQFLIRVLINAFAIALTAAILPGITVANDAFATYLIIGLIFGVVNAIIKPVLMLLTCPAVILSLGLFVLIINGCMLTLTASLAGDRLMIDGFGWAIVGGIIMSITSMILEGAILGKDEKGKER